MKRQDQCEIAAARAIMTMDNGRRDHLKLPAFPKGPHQNGGPEIKMPVILTNDQFATRTRKDGEKIDAIPALFICDSADLLRCFQAESGRDGIAHSQERAKPPGGMTKDRFRDRGDVACGIGRYRDRKGIDEIGPPEQRGQPAFRGWVNRRDTSASIAKNRL